MTPGDEKRRRILHYLKDKARAGATPPHLLDELAADLDLAEDDLTDQIDILDDHGAIDASWAISNSAVRLRLKGTGKVMLEEWEQEFGGEAAESTREEPESQSTSTGPDGGFRWDVFIAHASEDKKAFVEELATRLNEEFEVWYDEFTLEVGDSLREKIDEGLANSRFGIVVLSPNFFKKQWPKDELDGLVARQRDGGKVILPVWLDVDFEGVKEFSPMLAGRLAAKANDGMDQVVADLNKAMGQSESKVEEPHAENSTSVEGGVAATKRNFADSVDSGVERWTQLTEERFGSVDDSPYNRGYWVAAYAIQGEFPDLSLSSLINMLAAIRGQTGWPPWGVPTRTGLRPYMFDDGIECWLADEERDPGHSDFWRATLPPRLFLLRGYQEDSMTRAGAPGSLFDLTLPVWRVGEVMLHAAHLAESLEAGDSTVRFQFTWQGLEGRRLESVANRRRDLGGDYVAKQNQLTTQVSSAADVIQDVLPELVQSAVLRLYEIFDFFQPPTEMYQQELARMRSRST